MCLRERSGPSGIQARAALDVLEASWQDPVTRLLRTTSAIEGQANLTHVGKVDVHGFPALPEEVDGGVSVFD